MMNDFGCDILVFAPHPDDAEIHCGGIIAQSAIDGLKVVICDATEGELGSRGSVPERYQEAAAAAKVLGLHDRCNAQLPDGGLRADCPEQRNALVQIIRRYRPRLVPHQRPHRPSRPSRPARTQPARDQSQRPA